MSPLDQLRRLFADLNENDRYLSDLREGKVGSGDPDVLVDPAELEDYLGQRGYSLQKEIRWCARALGDPVIDRLSQERWASFNILCAMGGERPDEVLFARVVAYDRRIRERALHLLAEHDAATGS